MPKLKHTAIRLPPDLFEILKTTAATEERSVSNTVVRLIREGLATRGKCRIRVKKYHKGLRVRDTSMFSYTNPVAMSGTGISSENLN